MTPAESSPWMIEKPPGWCLTFWVIYDHPSDAPHGYMLRAHFTVRLPSENLEQFGWVTYVNKAAATIVSRFAWYSADIEQLHSIMPPSCTLVFRRDDSPPPTVPVDPVPDPGEESEVEPPQRDPVIIEEWIE